MKRGSFYCTKLEGRGPSDSSFRKTKAPNFTNGMRMVCVKEKSSWRAKNSDFTFVQPPLLPSLGRRNALKIPLFHPV